MPRISPQFCLTIACMLLLGYFVYHGVYGKHGLNASREIDLEAGVLRAQLAKLEARKTALDHRISLMLPESLDPDMLDESARSSLGFAHPNDLIILIPGQ